MIRQGMIVRTPDGEKLGRVESVGAEDYVIEHGVIFKHRIVAPLEHVIAVDDEKDEIITRPVELPEEDRARMMDDMWFGTAETEDELENKIEEDELATQLLNDPHVHRS